MSRGKLKTRFAFDDIQNSFTCCCQRQKHMLTFYVFLPPWGELQLLQSCTTQTRCHHGQLKLGWGKSSQAGPWFGQPLFQYCMEVFGSLTWNKIKWIEMFCMYFISSDHIYSYFKTVPINLANPVSNRHRSDYGNLKSPTNSWSLERLSPRVSGCHCIFFLNG